MTEILVEVIKGEMKDGYRLIKVEAMHPTDIRTPDEAMPYGIDSNPIKGTLALLHDTIERAVAVITGYIQTNRKAAPGEVRIYSTDASGEEQFYTWLKNDGTMEIGGVADNMVRYSKLEEAYNQLKSDHNGVVNDNNNLKAALVALVAALTSASPAPLTGASLSTIVSTALAAYYGAPLLPSTGDITPAKIDEIKTL